MSSNLAVGCCVQWVHFASGCGQRVCKHVLKIYKCVEDFHTAIIIMPMMQKRHFLQGCEQLSCVQGRPKCSCNGLTVSG